MELLATEGVNLEFDEDAIREMARMAALLNKTVENIGARRLHTVMERIMEELSFQAAEEEEGTVLTVSKKLIEERLSEAMTKSDLSSTFYKQNGRIGYAFYIDNGKKNT